jgi:hypothetical protein
MKIGSVVRVLKGDVLDRVGYDETLASAEAKMRAEILARTGNNLDQVMGAAFPFAEWADKTNVISELTKIYNRKVLRFGGREKKVFTNHHSEYDGMLAQVTRRIVKYTGKYEYADSDGPAYLSNKKCHVFYDVVLINNGRMLYNPNIWSTSLISTKNNVAGGTFIEKSNLEFLYVP